MSLSSWSSSNSSILAWNSSSEFKMWLSRDKTFPCFQATYLPRGTSGFFVAEWIALGLTCPGDLCVFKFCLQLREYPFHSEPRAVEEKFFLELLDPFMDADGFRALHKDFMLSKLMSCRMISLSPFPSKISSWRADTSLNFINAKPESFSHGDRCQSKVFNLFEWQPCEFRFVLAEGSSWVLQSLDSRLLDRFSTPHFQSLGKNQMSCSTSGSCDVLQGTYRLVHHVREPPAFLTHSGQELPSISTYSQCRG